MTPDSQEKKGMWNVRNDKNVLNFRKALVMVMSCTQNPQTLRLSPPDRTASTFLTEKDAMWTLVLIPHIL